MTSEQLKDIVDWDVENWSKALIFWENKLAGLNKPPLKCLELGAQRGGLSLWLALKGHHVVCSDLHSPEVNAKALHQKYAGNLSITYQSVDATAIGLTEQFDIIVFKSILGGVSRNNQHHFKKQTINAIYTALKPNGVLLFAENMESTFIHRFLRNQFTNSGGWNYLKLAEMKDLLNNFKTVELKTAGFLGTFGRNEWQRKMLGLLDRALIKVIPKHRRYIVFGIAHK